MTSECAKCKSRVNERNSTILTCALCLCKYHLNCTDVDATQKQAITGSVSVYACSTCKNTFTELKRANERLLSENERAKEANKQLFARLEKFEENNRTLKNEIKQEILNEIRPVNSSPDSNQRSMQEEVTYAMREQREQEKRKNNLCIQNFPESEDGSENGIQALSGFIAQKLELNETELIAGLTNFKRIGEQGDRDRAIVVRCSEMSLRRKILLNAPKLKDYRTSRNKRVFIAPDLTKLQQEEDKKLKDELWARRNRGERVVIRRGRIITLDTNVSRE